MENCLVTKLKMRIDNSDLLPLGAISFNVESGDVFKFQLYSLGAYELHLIGDAYFMDTLTMSGYYNTNADDSKDIESSGNHDFVISGQSAKLIIVDKSYSITRLSMPKNRIKVNDISVLGYRSQIEYLGFANTTIYGEVSNLSQLHNLKVIHFNNAIMEVDYDISIFNKCSSLDEFLAGQYATGILERFVEKQYSIRSDSSMGINIYNSNVTFNGKKTTTNQRYTITYGGGLATVVFNGVTVGTYNGSGWSYPSN